MLFRIVRPMKRPDSSMITFRQRIPQDIAEKARGKKLSLPIGDQFVTMRITDRATHVKVSLRTRDPSEAKIRQAAVAAHLEGVWRSLRVGPQRLTHKQTVALAGELYRDWVAAIQDDPVSPEVWKRVNETNRRAFHLYESPPKLRIGEAGPPNGKWVEILEERFGSFADILLARRGLVVDDASRETLLVQTGKAMQDAADRLKANAEGDYRPDTVAERFPRWEEPKVVNTTAHDVPVLSLRGLVEDWWKDAQRLGRKPRTYEGYDATIRKFVAFLGHDDATKVTVEDVRRFKDHRLQAGIKPKTVRENDLASLRSVLGWAVEEGRLSSNPVEGVRVRQERVEQKREKSFTATEAAAILRAAHSYERPSKQHQKIADARRWSPWLCAYSGARIGEILQLRPIDIRQDDGIHCMVLTPEAGSIKENKAKTVPLHQHIIEIGFLEFVKGCDPEGYLFLKVLKSENIAGQKQTTLNRVAEYIRHIVPDPEVRPNHGWRHTFKTIGLEVGIEG